jgi:hypothetical protein
VKGARISVNKRGTFVNLGANGIYYRQRIDSPGNSVREEVPEIKPSQNFNHTISTADVEKVTDVDSRSFIKELEEKSKRFEFFIPFGVLISIFIFFWGISYLNEVVRTVESSKDVFTIAHRKVNIREMPSKNSTVIYRAQEFEKFDRAGTDTIEWARVFVKRNPDQIGFVHSSMGAFSKEIANHSEFTRVEDYPVLKFLFAILVICLIGWCVFLYRFDKKRKTLELHYTMDDATRELYESFLSYFKDFSSSKKIWQNLHRQDVSDSKYHAGATQLVSRIPVGGIYTHRLPSTFLKTNVKVPCIKLKGIELYFFPERIILKRGLKFGAMFYRNITISNNMSKFVEEESLPSDATVIDYTWKYLNKNGGPDRRFSNNRQIPICLYSEYAFESDSGLNEVITTSKTGGMDGFSKFIDIIADFQRTLNLN